MRRLLILLLAVPLSLVGCLSGGEDPAAPASVPENKTVEVGDRPEATFTDIVTGPAAGPDLNATLDAAPRLVKGEWWKIHLVSPLTGADVTFIRVVADIDGDVYVIGMPHEGWYKEAVIYHSPAFGDVNMDLSYRAHNIPFIPLKFPLTDGATWETEFEGPPKLKATVKVNADGTATITYTTPQGGVAIEQVYDPKEHEVVKFKNVYMTYEVVEHGYDFQGWITVPRGEKLVFLHGRVGPALDVNLQPAAPIEQVEVEQGYNRLSFILAAGNPGIAPTPYAPGFYQETATGPDGKTYELQAPPTGEFVSKFFEATSPGGTWEFQHIAAGPGLVFIEGIAYHQYDIRLPDGARRSDHAHPVVR